MSINDEDIDSRDESSSIQSMLRSESAIETRARSIARISQEAINNQSISISHQSIDFIQCIWHTSSPPGWTVTTNTNSSASTSAATNGPTPVEIPPAQNMTIEQVTQLMQSLLSSNFQNNLSQPSSPVQVVPTAPLKQAPQSEYVTTSTAQSKLIEVIKFNNNVIILRVASYYGDNGNVSDFPADSRLLVYLHLHSDADNYAGRERGQPPFRHEAALFCALGWYVHSNETLRQFGKARNDVKLGWHNLMRLIFIIGARYMNANINLALVTADADSQH